MKLVSSFAIALLAILLISCANPVRDSSQLYHDFRNSWRNTNNFQFLNYYYPDTTDEGDIENIKAEREHIAEEVDDLRNFVSIDIDSIRELDKWIFENHVFYDGTVEIVATMRYGDNLTYTEIAYVIIDENNKRWIAHSQIRKESK